MDEMRIVSKFTRGIISKAIKMVIRKKTGYNVDIQLNEAITTINDGKTHLHLEVDAELDKDEHWFKLTERGAYNASFLLLRKIYKAYYERNNGSEV